ncbi:MAG: Rne/Rng family ribonuclease, partial [Pseudobdellovibrionaceae bacterium]
IFRELERDLPQMENKKSNIVIHTHQEVVDWIYEVEGETLNFIEQKIGKSVAFKIEPTYHVEQYEIFIL